MLNLERKKRVKEKVDMKKLIKKPFTGHFLLDWGTYKRSLFDK